MVFITTVLIVWVVSLFIYHFDRLVLGWGLHLRVWLILLLETVRLVMLTVVIFLMMLVEILSMLLL